MRHKISISSILAISLLILSMCSCEKAASGPSGPVPVRTASVESIRIGNPVKYSATIVPYAQVDLSFKSSGYVDQVLQVKGVDGRARAVDQGDWVKKGTVLAVVQQQDYRDKLQQAQSQLMRSQAEYDKAKTSFDRTNALYASKSATKPDYDSAKAQLDSTTASVDAAKAQISEAQVALDYCSLRAPFDAWVVKRNVDVGSLVGPATNGFTIADTRTVRVVFGVPDIAIAGVKLGDRMAITTDALPGMFYGRVTTISPAADPKSRVYSVEVAIDNSRNQLKSGMIATLSLGSDDLSKPVTVVPLEAVVRDPRQSDAYAVMVAEGTGDSATARMRPVELGNAYGNKIGIVKGVDINQRVITAGATMLRDGDAVRVVP
jgi:multidrug efflux system membrane fusion protein